MPAHRASLCRSRYLSRLFLNFAENLSSPLPYSDVRISAFLERLIEQQADENNRLNANWPIKTNQCRHHQCRFLDRDISAVYLAISLKIGEVFLIILVAYH